MYKSIGKISWDDWVRDLHKFYNYYYIPKITYIGIKMAQ